MNMNNVMFNLLIFSTTTATSTTTTTTTTTTTSTTTTTTTNTTNTTTTIFVFIFLHIFIDTFKRKLYFTTKIKKGVLFYRKSKEMISI